MAATANATEPIDPPPTIEKLGEDADAKRSA
jgi:hypothetical protein